MNNIKTLNVMVVMIIFLKDIIWPVIKRSVRWIMKSKNEMIRFSSIHLSSIIIYQTSKYFNNNSNNYDKLIDVSNFHNYFNISLSKIESFDYTSICTDNINSCCTSGNSMVSTFGTNIKQSHITFSVWKQWIGFFRQPLLFIPHSNCSKATICL